MSDRPGTTSSSSKNGKAIDELHELLATLDSAKREKVRAVLMVIDELDGNLESIILDPAIEAETRRTACWLAARLHGEAAGPILLKAIAFDELRSRCVLILGQIGYTEAFDELAALLSSDPDEEIRALTAFALGEMDDARAVEPLVERLSDREEWTHVRGEAAEALGKLGDDRALSILLETLNDPATEVRFWSAFALGCLADERAIEPLTTLADSDDSSLPGYWKVADEALDAIDAIKRNSGE